MKEPIWINEAIVIPIHRRQLSEHGGPDGLRDKGLLASALNNPKQLWHYNDPKPDIAALAASYAHSIARNHPFVDGNKRTAFVIYRLFLKLNGAVLSASQEDKYRLFIALAAGEITETELAEWTRENSDQSE